MSKVHTPINRVYDVRLLITKAEVSEIQHIQEDDAELSQHYPRHSQWLVKALEDVTKGTYIAFGAFKIAFGQNSMPTVALVGSIMLRPRPYANVIEIKNLYVKPDSRMRGCGKALYAHAEQYCARTGYSAIETEVPCTEIGTVGFLHKFGYVVAATRDSPYTKNAQLYTMVKYLLPHYAGDPFDVWEIGAWLMSNYFFFSSISCNKAENRYAFTMQQDVFGPSEYIDEQLSLKGTMLVFSGENAATIEKLTNLQKEKFNLVLVLGVNFSDSVREYAAASRIKVIDTETVYHHFGKRFAYPIPDFDKKDVAGMIVVMNPDFFDRIDQGDGSFTYFKSGPSGKYLEREQKLIIYSESTTNNSHGGVQGYGQIVDVKYGPPHEVWECFANHNPLFNEEEFNRYSENKKNILGISVINFNRIQPLSFDELPKEIIGSATSVANIGHLYVSNKMMISFLNVAKTQEDMNLRNTQEVLDNDSELVKVLFLTANPNINNPPDFEAELRCLELELERVRYREKFILIPKCAVQPDDLLRFVSEEQPTIVHFSGHASDGGIILRSDAGEYTEVTGANLRQLLDGRDVKLLVLNTCSNKEHVEKVGSVVGSIIGTTKVLDDEAARRFTVAFYRALGNGQSIRNAFRDGKDAVVIHGHEADVFYASGDLGQTLVND